MEDTPLEDSEYLYASRDFLFEVLHSEIKELEEWKLKPKSYLKDLTKEFEQYDLTNDNLMSLSYGVSVPQILKDSLATARDTCEEEVPRMDRLQSMYQQAVDQYLGSVLESAPSDFKRRRFLKGWEADTGDDAEGNVDADAALDLLALAVTESVDGSVGATSNTESVSVLGYEAAQELAAKSMQEKKGHVEAKSPSASPKKDKASSESKGKWSQTAADSLLYGDTHHPDKDTLKKHAVDSKKNKDKGGDLHSDHVVKIGPKPFWNKLTGCVDLEMLEGTTVKKILLHHEKVNALSAKAEFSSDAAARQALKNKYKNKGKKDDSATADDADAAKLKLGGAAGSAGDMDSSYQVGPSIGIPFKPPFWKQFESTTQGQQKMDLLRKEAMQQRHNSTYVVASPGASAGTNPMAALLSPDSVGSPSIADMSGLTIDTAAEGADEAALTSPGSSGKMKADSAVNFTDLIKSMEVFYHLKDDDIAKMESKCAQVHFADSELIITEGDLGATAYIINNGFVFVQQESKSNLATKEHMGSLNRGDVFGDTSSSTESSARKMKSSFVATGGGVAAYALTGDAYRKYAYKKNKNWVPPNLAAVSSPGRGSSKNTSSDNKSENTKASRKAKQKIEALINTNDKAVHKQEEALLEHIEAYLEFLLLFKTERSEQLFDGSHDHIVPNTHKQSDFGSSEEQDEENASSGRGGMGEIFQGGANRARKSISSLLHKTQDSVNSQMSASHREALRNDFEQHNARDKKMLALGDEQQDGEEKGEEDLVDHFSSIFGAELGGSRREGLSAILRADQEAETKALELKQKNVVSARRRLMLAMLGAASPELELAETLEVMLRLIQDFFHVDRVGVFVIDKIKNSMTLYMSQFDRMAKLDEQHKKAMENYNNEDDDPDEEDEIAAKKKADPGATSDALYVVVPLKGIAGHIAKTGDLIVMPDCYEHPLFDSNMDEKTGYRTKQMLCVPCFDSAVDGSVVGVLQAINPTGVANTAKAVADEERQMMEKRKEAGKYRTGKRSKKSRSVASGESAAAKKVELARMKSDPNKNKHNHQSTALALNESDSSSSSEESGGDDDDDEEEHDIAKSGGKVNFTKTDEMLGVIVSQLVGSVIGMHKNRKDVDLINKNGVQSGVSQPASFIRKPFSLRMHNVIFQEQDNHNSSVHLSGIENFPVSMTCTYALYDGVNQVGESKYTKDVERHDVYNGAGAPDEYTKKTIAFEKSLGGLVTSWKVDEIIEFPEVWIRNLPLSARLVMQFYSSSGQKAGKPLGWCALDVFNSDRELMTGRRIVRLWDGECNSAMQLFAWPMRTSKHNDGSSLQKYAQFELKSFDRLVVFAPSTVNKANLNFEMEIASLNMPLAEQLENLTGQEYFRFMVLNNISRGYCSEPVRNLCIEDRQLIWKLRRALVHSTTLLPVFLLSVPWEASEGVYEAYQLLAQWRVQKGKWKIGQHHHEGFGGVNDNNSSHAMGTRTIALSLLYGTTFADSKIRAFAVIQLLKGLNDDDLAAILLPLVGALKYERNTDNALIRFLMRRSIECPDKVGIPFYWHLKSQMDLLPQGTNGYDNPSCVAYYQMLSNLIKRKSGDRVRTSLGHAEIVHIRLANICRHIMDNDAQHEKVAVSNEAQGNYGFGTGGGIGTGSKDMKMDKTFTRTRALVKLIKEVELPSAFDFPGNPKYRVNELVRSECKYQKTWPYRSLKVVFRVDEGDEIRKRVKKSQNTCELWMRTDVDPSPEKVALAMMGAFDSLWQTYGLDLHVQKYNLIHQLVKKDEVTDNDDAKRHESDKFNSCMVEVPMHAKTFQDIISTHNIYHDVKTTTKTSAFGGIFGGSKLSTNGVSKTKDMAGILSSGPKEYATLHNREFPNDVMENWFCMHNFESKASRFTSDEENLRTLGTNHPTVYEKYYAKKGQHKKRKSLFGASSLRMTIDGQQKVDLFEPNPESFEWRLKFARSLAGFYVSSYVLHIINRTGDNIMFLPSGEIFNFELNCLNIEERLAKLKADKQNKKDVPYCGPPPKEGTFTNAPVEDTRRARETTNQGYSTLDSLHKEANHTMFSTVPAAQIESRTDESTSSFRGIVNDSKVSKRRAANVISAVAASARKIGVDTGNYTNKNGAGSGEERTHVPLLPCFTHILGPSNSSMFAYFREYALNAFTVLRSHPEYLLQVLKSSLSTIPALAANEYAESTIAAIVEAMMANLMIEMEEDDESARNKFLSHIQIDMAYFSQTATKNSYPAQKRFEEK